MATRSMTSASADDAAFFLKIAVAIAITIVGSFSMHFAMGRSTLAVPAVYHLHGLAYMFWVAIFVIQHWLAAKGRIDLHRRIGRIAMAWVALLVVMGIAITVTVIQRGTTPFFFLPQHFLVANPLTLLGFVVLVGAAVALRLRTDWHRRLQLCAMAMILGPAFGRLLPSPLMIPYAFEIGAMAGLIFPLIAVAREWRAGSVHPAWKWGLPVLPLALLLGYGLGHSALAGEIYAWVTAGTPGASIDPLAYGTPPPGM
jgi:hypothetical protein